MLPHSFSIEPKKTLLHNNTKIYDFRTSNNHKNIDNKVVESFGDEWLKFNSFTDSEIKKLGDMYFDILTPEIINKNTYMLDVGCGTGRFSKYLAKKAGFIEAIDAGNAIFAAQKLLSNTPNVRLSIASTDNIPFNDNTFDFVMSIGVLHHIPDTLLAMRDCVKKVKPNGYFYVYLYYNLDNKGLIPKLLLKVVTILRLIISSLPGKLKRITCDIISIIVYMPFIIIGRMLKLLGFEKIAQKIPLNIYQNQSFYIVRNDALDRFGTKLEQRFSKKQIEKMMQDSGLSNIIISDNLPYWHCIGKKL